MAPLPSTHPPPPTGPDAGGGRGVSPPPGPRPAMPGDAAQAGPGLVAGRRKLYEPPPGGRPDNHTDASFLGALVLNAHIQRRAYRGAVADSLAIAQQLCVAAASGAAFAHLHGGRLAPERLLRAAGALVALGVALDQASGPGRLRPRKVLRVARQSALLAVGVHNLSPLLRSLTRTVSTDSALALATLLGLVHLYCHDYHFVNSVTDHLTGTVSVGAGVVATVLLASRLRTDLQAFSYILFSLELVVLSPFLRRSVARGSKPGHAVLTALMVLGTAALLRPFGGLPTAAFAALVAAVTFAFPALLVSSEKYKVAINGPWDEAWLTPKYDRS